MSLVLDSDSDSESESDSESDACRSADALPEAAGPDGSTGPRPRPRRATQFTNRSQPTFTGRPSWRRALDVAPTPLLPAAVAFGVAFFTWFRGGRFFATGDVVPFERAGYFAELGSLWTHGNSGGGSPSFEIARLGEAIVVRTMLALGGSGADAQRLWLSACFAFAAFGGAALTAAVCRRRFPAVIAGLFTAFNAYLLVQVPNPIPMVTLGVMGSLAALAITGARRGRPHTFRLALATLPCSYLAINPPLLAVTAAWLIAIVAAAPLLVGGERAHRRLGHQILLALPAAVALNIWWVAPLVIATRGGGEGVTLAANIDVVSWAWTHANSSPGSVLSLLTHWGWGRTEYFPFATGLNRPLWAWTRWLAPLGVLAAPLLARGRARRLALWLLCLLGALVFLAKGLNPPLAAVNLWCYRHVPGFWLLREPMSKLGSILVLVFALGWGLALDGRPGQGIGLRGAAAGLRAGQRSRRETRAGDQRRVAIAVLGVLAVAAVAFPLPLWTGTVATQPTSNGRAKLVATPAAWDEVATVVNGSPVAGKVLMLPLDDYYQVPTTWGLYGADHLARRLFDRPVLFLRPGGYFGEAPALEAMMHRAEQLAAEPAGGDLRPLLSAMGVSQVVVRRDIDRSNGIRPLAMADGSVLAAGLQGRSELVHRLANEVADVFEITREPTADGQAGPADPVQVKRGLIDASQVAAHQLADVEATLPPTFAALTSAPGVALAPADLVRGGVEVSPWATDDLTVRVDAPSALTVEQIPEAAALFEAGWVGEDGARSTVAGRRLGLWPADRVAVDGTPLPVEPAGLVTVHDGADGAANRTEPAPGVVAVAVGGSATPLGDSRELVAGRDGDPVEALAPAGPSLLAGDEGLGDCNRADERSPEAAGLTAETVEGGVRLTAESHAACVAYKAPLARPGWHLVRLEMAHVEGEQPRICLWLAGPERCAALPALGSVPAAVPSSEGWSAYEAVFDIPEGTRDVRLVVYADGRPEAGGRTVNAYRRMALVPLQVVGTTTVRVGTDAVRTVDVGTGSHTVSTTLAGRHASLGSWGALRDCNRSDDRSPAQAGLLREAVDGAEESTGVRLSARAHSACVAAPVVGFEPARSYEVSVEVRWESGERPRWCLFQIGPQRCAPMDPLAKATTWTTFTTVVTPEPGTTGLLLYVYADAASVERTTVAYRNATVRAVGSSRLTVRHEPLGAEPLAAPPSVTWSQEDASRYHLVVDDAPKPFVVALSEHFSDGWALRGLPRGASASHVHLDGYRNGWIVDPGPVGGRLELQLEYVPSRLARNLWLISLFTLPALAVVAVARRRAPRRREDFFPRRPSDRPSLSHLLRKVTIASPEQ